MKTKFVILFTVIVSFMFAGSLKAQWQQAGEIPPYGAMSFAVNGSNIFAGYGNNIYMSSNNGSNWTNIYTTAANTYAFALTANGTDLFAGIAGAGIFLTTNNGTNWTPMNNGLSNNSIYSILINGSYMFAASGSNGGAFISTNYGVSWSPNAGSPLNIYSLVLRGNKLIAGTACGVFVTTDNGANWINSSSGLPSCCQVRTLAVVDSNIYAGLISNGGGAYLSTDNGANWTPVRSGLSTYNVLGIAGTGSNIFASTPQAGVFFSSNSGSLWSPINTGLTGTSVSALKIIGSYIFLGMNTGGSGIWKRPLAELLTGVEPVNSEIPNGFLLEQNYPNPFNPSTKIAFSIPPFTKVGLGGFVQLAVYDITGREVTVLLNESLKPGKYEVTFDASALSSGVYFYKLSAGEFSVSKTMCLIK